MTFGGELEAGQEARTLIRATPVATLATTLAAGDDSGDGWPYASLVLVATDFSGEPLLFISEIAEHTKNILTNARVSLLYDSAEAPDQRLAGARLTVLGHASKSNNETAKARYMARHPEAKGYAAFADFGLYRVKVARAHLVAGFGKILWIERAELRLRDAEMSALAEAEAGILAHMNGDHADAISAYATVLLKEKAGPWKMTGCDPEGCDLRAGHRVARLTFPNPIASAKEARTALADLAKMARAG